MSDLNEATAKETRRVTTGSDGVAVVRTDDATRISITADLDMHTARRARSIIESVCEARPSNVVIDQTSFGPCVLGLFRVRAWVAWPALPAESVEP